MKEPDTLPANQVLHILGSFTGGLLGYLPIVMAKKAIGIGLAYEE